MLKIIIAGLFLTGNPTHSDINIYLCLLIFSSLRYSAQNYLLYNRGIVLCPIIFFHSP